MKKLLSLACTFALVTLILLTGCGKKPVPFTIPDFLENGLYHTQQEIFSRYGYDEASASAVTPPEAIPSFLPLRPFRSAGRTFTLSFPLTKPAPASCSATGSTFPERM